MAYFVAHMQKFSNNLGGLKSHNERDTKNHSNKNIDVSKKNENEELVSSRDSEKSYEFEFKKVMKKKYDHRTKNGELRKIRENQVKFNSFVFSASPEFFEKKSKEQQIKYFKDCKKYLETKISSENIISAKIHFDETTPHMHLVAVPLTNDGRLSSKEIFNKQFLRDLQEDCPQFLKNNGHEITRGENAEGINKRVTDLEFKKNKAIELEKKLDISETRTTSVSNYSEFERKMFQTRKIKLNLASQKAYKIYEGELKIILKDGSQAQEKQKENKYLKEENKKLNLINSELKKKNSKTIKLEKEISKLNKFKEFLETNIPKEKMDELKNEFFEESKIINPYDTSKFINPYRSKIKNPYDTSKENDNER